MTWHIAVQQEAARDIEFTSELDHVLARMTEKPRQFPEIESGFRRALLRRFPYGVYFCVERNRLIVLAVLHLHRHPGSWRSRK